MQTGTLACPLPPLDKGDYVVEITTNRLQYFGQLDAPAIYSVLDCPPGFTAKSNAEFCKVGGWGVGWGVGGGGGKSGPRQASPIMRAVHPTVV